jgi:tripartite ATP-independent transporter DctP family solute receptor
MKTGLLAVLATTTMIAGAAQADVITLAHGANPGNPRYLAAEMFASLVGACTGGDTTVEVAPSATMGDDVEMLSSAAAGIINITANSQGAMSQIVPEIGLLGLPFLFADLPTAWEVLDGEVGDMLDARANEAGLTILGFWDNGIRQVSHTGMNVTTPDALAGMQIRTPPDQMTVAIFEALGASPAPLAWSELPTALQSGVFEGQENPLVNIYSARLHEITPYITMTGHKYESTPVVAGLAWWSGLDADTQGCIEDATAQAGWYQRGLSLEGANSLRATMEAEGAIFAEVEDRAAFIEATAPVYDAYAEQFPELVAALQAATGQ